MDASPTEVWRRPAQPGRGGRIRCVRWNRLQALRHQTPDTSPPLSSPPSPPSVLQPTVTGGMGDVKCHPVVLLGLWKVVTMGFRHKYTETRLG